MITVNGNEADIYTPIHANDQIKVTESTAGEAGQGAYLSRSDSCSSSIVHTTEKFSYTLVSMSASLLLT